MILIEVILVTFSSFCILTIENLSKSQKLVSKISVVKFRYSQTIFLWFTVILLMILKLMTLWNFVLKFNLRTWSLLNLNCTHCILINARPTFCANRLINFIDIFNSLFLLRQNSKNQKTDPCMKLNCLFITMIMKFLEELYFDVS